eukprot:gene7039-8184_t
MTHDNEKLNALVRSLPNLVNDIYSNDDTTIAAAVKSIRMMLSLESTPPIDQVIEIGVVPRLLFLVQSSENENIQYEAAWALTNIASGTREQTMVLVNLGAIPVFVGLLNSPYKKVCEQVLWCIGNISGDSPQLRDLVLQNKVITNVQKLVNRYRTELSLIKNVAWTLSNFSRGKPPPSQEYVKLYLPFLAELAKSTTDVELLTDTLWSFAFLSDTTDDKLSDYIISLGIVPLMIDNLTGKDTTVLVPSLRTIGNILSGNDVQTQIILNHGVLKHFEVLAKHPKVSIRKEVFWSLSNITSGTRAQIQQVIESNILPGIIQKAYPNHSEPIDAKKEIMWILVNATSGGSFDQLLYLEQHNIIGCLMKVLTDGHIDFRRLALEGVANLMLVDKQKNTFKPLLMQNHFPTILENIRISDPESFATFESLFSSSGKGALKDLEDFGLGALSLE